MFEMLIGVGAGALGPDKESAQPGDWYFHEGEWYYCAMDSTELKNICSPFLNDTDPNQIRTVRRSGESHDIPLNNIDTRYVTDTYRIFYQASNFNQNISKWNVSNVTDMRDMFRDARNFNQPIGGWDVSSVTNMLQMFQNATSFNRSISNWNVSSVANVQGMFVRATSFNQSIGNWDVSNVVDMHYMFWNATSFNQNLSKWCVTNIKSKPDYFNAGSKLTTANLPIWGTCPNG